MTQFWSDLDHGSPVYERRKLAKLNGKRSTESYTFRGDS